MKVIHPPRFIGTSMGPFVQFTDEEHDRIDESLALRERMIKESPMSGLYGNLTDYFATGAIRDSLHPVWMLVKYGADTERKEVKDVSTVSPSIKAPEALWTEIMSICSAFYSTVGPGSIDPSQGFGRRYPQLFKLQEQLEEYFKSRKEVKVEGP